MAVALAALTEALRDRYAFERELGRGGMATVYLARDLRHDRWVALKVLHPDLAAAVGQERFLREIRLAARLNHPHIVPLFDSGEAAGLLYYAMPYIQGESLRTLLDRAGPLGLADTTALVRAIAGALDYAHRQDLVHRDIKPENVLLHEGEAMVTDFGIAKPLQVDAEDTLTQTGLILGTPGYMSPEQACGREQLDGRSDVYSLGCLAYEMLTGRRPFYGSNALAILAQHITVPAPLLRAVRPDVPVAVEQALTRALAKAPAERFATPGAFARALDAATEGADPGVTTVTGPATAAGAGSATPFQTSPAKVRGRRTSAVLTTVAFGGLVLLAGYLVAFVTGHRERPGPHLTLAVLPIEDLSGDTARAYLAEGLTDELITDLAGVRALDVVNRRTMMTYRGSQKTARQIAQELSADAIVVGAIQRRGDTMHQSAQLVLVGQDQAVWAQSYTGAPGDLMSLQKEIARAVAERVRGVLAPEERASLASARAHDPEAVDRYIRGRYWWNKRNGPALLHAIQFFGQALDVDPTFAPAYSGMADAYVQLGYGSLLRPDDAFPKARAAAQKALELDSTLAEPHATLGYVALYFDWDLAAAEREFRVAIARNPSYATAHEWYGLLLTVMGRFNEAQAEERRAQALEPLSVAVSGTAGWVLHYSGKQRDAERVLRSALRADSTFPLGHLYLGRVLQFEGQLDSALVHFEATGPLRDWVPTIAGEGYVYAQQGRRDAAQAVLRRLDSLSATRYVTPYAVALVHAALHQPDSAFAWLDRAVNERTHWVVWLNRDLRWTPVHGDPRFAALVHRVGLPP